MKQDAKPEKPPNVEGCLNVGLIVIEVFLLLPGFALLLFGLEVNKKSEPHATVTKLQADAAFILLLCAVSLLTAAALLEFCRRRFVKKRLPTE